jgi:hypothetical protein
MLKFKGINYLSMATGEMDKTIDLLEDIPT